MKQMLRFLRANLYLCIVLVELAAFAFLAWLFIHHYNEDYRKPRLGQYPVDTSLQCVEGE